MWSQHMVDSQLLTFAKSKARLDEECNGTLRENNFPAKFLGTNKISRISHSIGLQMHHFHWHVLDELVLSAWLCKICRTEQAAKQLSHRKTAIC